MALKPLQTDQAPLVETSKGLPTTVFYTWLKSFADVALALFNGTGPAWTAYTPTVTASAGAITSYTATGRSYQLGKVVFVQIRIQIINAGSGTGALIATLPVTPNSSFTYSLAAWENDAPAGATSIIRSGVVNAIYASGSTLVVASTDVTLCGTYEAA
jgi:hypothetical protein